MKQLIRIRNLIGYAILGAVAGYGTYTYGKDFGEKYVAITKVALFKTIKKTVDHVQNEAKKAVGRARSQARQSVRNLRNSAKQSGKDLVSQGGGMLNVGNIFSLATGKKSFKDIKNEAKQKVKNQENVLKGKLKAEEDRLKAQLKNVFDVKAVERQIKADVISAGTYAVKKHWDLLLIAIISLFVLIGSIFLIVKNVILFVLILLGKTTIGSAKLVGKAVKKKKK